MDPQDRLDAAAALRDLNHAFAAAEADADALRTVTETARNLAVELDGAPRRDRLALIRAARERAQGATMFEVARPGSGFEDRAVGGSGNPTSFDFDITHEDEDIVAAFVLRKGFDHAPGRAHGGMVAAAFDDVTGFVIGRVGEPAFTGELTVRFVAPVPVEEPLTIRTRLEGRERRKLFISGEMAKADGDLVATCHATYITVDPSMFAGAPDPR
jgi:acyl-coenzyme A thioesterase PaaI-like protein